MANQAFFLADYETLVNNVVVATETVSVYETYNEVLSCQQEEDLVNAMSEDQIKALRAQGTLTAPPTPAGKVVQPRNCASGDQIVVIDAGYVEDETTPTTPTEPTNTNYDSQGDLVGFVTTP